MADRLAVVEAAFALSEVPLNALLPPCWSMLTVSQGPTIASEPVPTPLPTMLARFASSWVIASVFVVPAPLSIPIVLTPAAPAAPVNAITAVAASNTAFSVLVVMWVQSLC